MKYVLALFSDERGWENLTPEDMAAGMEPWNRFEREIHDAGVHLAGEGLRPSAEAKAVKLVEGGEPLVTDGPFVETKEQLGGFYLIDVAGEDEALEWARKVPMRPGSTIEVRQVMDYEQFGLIDPAKESAQA